MITGYAVSCPCRNEVIEGSLVQVEGASPEIDEGAFVECSCGCLHRVHLVDHEAHLIALAKLTIDEQIATHRMMERDMVKFACPHCDHTHVTEMPPDFDPIGGVFSCPDCRGLFAVIEQCDIELVTRALSEAEAAEYEETLRRAIAARSVFGGGATPFGSDPFRPFGGP